MRVVEGVNSSMIYLIHWKNFCKCHNVLLPYKKKKNPESPAGMDHDRLNVKPHRLPLRLGVSSLAVV
jgi:hypothetical protein